MAPLNKEKGKPTQNGSQPRTVQKMWREERYTVLLVSVFFYIVLSVLLPDKTWGAIFLDFVFLILVFSVVFEAANVRAILSILAFWDCWLSWGILFYPSAMVLWYPKSFFRRHPFFLSRQQFTVFRSAFLARRL